MIERTSPDDAEIPGTGPTYEELLDVVRAYVDRRIRVKVGGDRRDIWIPVYRQNILDILDTAIRGAGAPGMRAVPILDEPEYLDTAAIKEFKWVGHRTDGKKTHLSKVACDLGFEVEFAEFLDACPDVLRWVKNERLGFSVTYFENARPRQYFPDFIAVVDDGSGGERWVVAETKGELWPNTHLKRMAAAKWCDQMTTAGQGHWAYLFVHQPVFNKAKHASIETLAGLTAFVGGAPLRLEPRVIDPDDPRVEEEQFENLLPLYSLRAAAGYFGAGEDVELEGWVEVESLKRLTARHFVARAVGNSMSPTIHDGDLCIFRSHPTGTRQNKVVLAQYQGPADPDTGGAFTVKRYYSEKDVDDDGEIRTRSVELRPDNPDFATISIGPEEDAVTIAAEFVAVLSRS